MIVGQQKFYHLIMQWEGCRKQLGLGFINPPVREDVRQKVMEEWNKLSKFQQDEAWEFVLILDYIPLIPFIGKIDCVYGTIECCERFILINEANDGSPDPTPPPERGK